MRRIFSQDLVLGRAILRLLSVRVCFVTFGGRSLSVITNGKLERRDQAWVKVRFIRESMFQECTFTKNRGPCVGNYNH